MNIDNYLIYHIITFLPLSDQMRCRQLSTKIRENIDLKKIRIPISYQKMHCIGEKDVYFFNDMVRGFFGNRPLEVPIKIIFLMRNELRVGLICEEKNLSAIHETIISPYLKIIFPFPITDNVILNYGLDQKFHELWTHKRYQEYIFWKENNILYLDKSVSLPYE